MNSYGAVIERLEDFAYDFIGTFKESLIALCFNIGNILSGFLLSMYLVSLGDPPPWIFLLYPGILSARGVVSGIFSANLTTKLKLGYIEPSLRKPSNDYKVLFSSMAALALIGSLFVSLVSLFVAESVLKVGISHLYAIPLVTVATMTLSFFALSPLTTVVAFYSSKLHLDPDKIVYPVMSTLADVVVTFCYFKVIEHVLRGPLLSPLLVLALLLLVIQAYLISVNATERDFIGLVKECVVMLFIISLIVNFSGSILTGIIAPIENQTEIITAYPALLAAVGDVGSITGSVSTTKLVFGEVEPSISLLYDNASLIAGVWAASMFMFAVYLLFSLFLLGKPPHNLWKGLYVLLLTNTLTIPMIIGVALVAAILTSRKGLNPDNFVIPIVSTLADALTTLSLYVSIQLLRV
mgnify:CR=1 FL=1